MIEGLTPYSEYKAVGLPWLESIPSHWRLMRAKALLRPIDQRSLRGEEELLTVSSARGIVPRSSANVTMFKAESYAGYKLCWPGDLVINSLWAWGRGLGVSQYHGIVSSAYGVYRARKGQQLNPRFLHQLVRSAPFQWELQVRSRGIWISRLQLTDEAFLDAPIPVPPIEEQDGIVRFLDHADRRIRSYIRAKQALIERLKEQKQAVIHRAVTRGLNPSALFKESGVERLGQVPEHWDVVRMRNVAELRVSNVDKHAKEAEQPVRLCNYVDVYKNDRISSSMEFMRATAAPAEVQRFRLLRNDVLITKDSESWSDIGVPALVEFSADDLVCGYHLALLRPLQPRMHGEFLFQALRSNALRHQFHVEANGVTRFGLSHSSIKSVWVPLPPPEEQLLIARVVDRATQALEKGIVSASREIDLIREHQARLLADAATGKVDVRDAASGLPRDLEIVGVRDEDGMCAESPGPEHSAESAREDIA